jgi:hypothetical protein
MQDKFLSKISVVTQDNANMTVNVLPAAIASGGFCMISLSPEKEVVLVARAFNSFRHIPAFKWKVTILSNFSIRDPILPTIQGSPMRYSGHFSPNNKLLLYRDVFFADKDHFPLAFRFGTDEETLSENSLGLASPTKDLCFSVKLIRKSDNVTLGDYRFRGLGQMYYITSDMFITSGAISDAAATGSNTAAAAAKKDTKKDAAPAKGGKGANSAVPSAGPPFPGGGTIVEFIIECKLDEEAMKVPSEWKSKFPFKFDAGSVVDASNTSADSQAIDANASTPQRKFSWYYDVIGGFVADISHDIQELQKFATMKNSWEESNEGRAERAMAAMAYWNEKKRIVREVCNVSDALNDTADNKMKMPTTELLTFLGTAWDKENVESIRENETLMVSSSQVYIYI